MTATSPSPRRVEVVLVDRAGRIIARDEHLRADPGTGATWAALADIVIGAPGGAAGARGELERLADAHPGALLVVVPRGDVCWVSLGGAAGRATAVVRAAAPTPEGFWAVWASVVHALLTGACATGLTAPGEPPSGPGARGRPAPPVRRAAPPPRTG